jgi:hypothetical protein
MEFKDTFSWGFIGSVLEALRAFSSLILSLPGSFPLIISYSGKYLSSFQQDKQSGKAKHISNTKEA